MNFGGQKRIWVIPVVVAAAVAVTGWWCNSEVRRAIENQLANELESMIGADVTALNIWIDNQLRFVSSLASEEKMRELAIDVVERAAKDGADGEQLRGFEEVQVLSDYVEPRMRPMRLGFVVIDPNGVIIAAPFEGMLGDQLHDEALDKFQEIFTDGEPVLLTPYQPPRRGGGPGGGPGGGRGPGRMEGERGKNGGFRGEPRLQGEGGNRGRLARGGMGEGPEREGGRNPGNTATGEERRGQFRGGARGPGGPGGPGGAGRGGGRRNRTIMAVAAPIQNDAGEVIAAIGLMIQPDQEFTRILSVARPGDSGETFAFDSNGIMLSQSRFETDLSEWGLIDEGPGVGGSALNLELRDPGGDLSKGYQPTQDKEAWPLTRLVADAVKGEAGLDVSGFRDYRGIPVVGAWQWLPKYEFGVATKLDASEAFQPLRVLRLVFLILLLLSVLSGVGLFLFSYFNVMLRRQMEDVALEAKELGQYTLEKKIGEGGMGAVYRARHALLRRDTAVKLLLPEKADDTSISRFEREVQMTCRLAHPNTIQIFDYGHTPEGIFYYAMEYLDGINLRDLIRNEGKIAPGRVVHILRQICASLSEAHDAGLVHRDIKPANVILCHRGGVPDMVKVLDFGLVKSYRDKDATASDVTQTLSITGTPQFIAPEAVSRPDQVDHRSDLYAVGALAYYLLSGDHVFTGESAFEVMQHHVSSEPEALRQRIGAPVDPILEKLVHQCLEKQASKRPQSARAILDVLVTCSSNGSWSHTEQEAWWSQFRRQSSEATETSQSKSSSILEPTLKIDLDDRTRPV